MAIKELHLILGPLVTSSIQFAFPLLFMLWGSSSPTFRENAHKSLQKAVDSARDLATGKSSRNIGGRGGSSSSTLIDREQNYSQLNVNDAAQAKKDKDLEALWVNDGGRLLSWLLIGYYIMTCFYLISAAGYIIHDGGGSFGSMWVINAAIFAVAAVGTFFCAKNGGMNFHVVTTLYLTSFWLPSFVESVYFWVHVTSDAEKIAFLETNQTTTAELDLVKVSMIPTYQMITGASFVIALLATIYSREFFNQFLQAGIVLVITLQGCKFAESMLLLYFVYKGTSYDKNAILTFEAFTFIGVVMVGALAIVLFSLMKASCCVAVDPENSRKVSQMSLMALPYISGYLKFCEAKPHGN